MKTPAPVYLLFFFCYFIGFAAKAQKEASYWYFGNKAGLYFTSSNQTLLRDNGKMKALEGCATISDSLGNLLFYTAGDTVFNKSHVKMSNGWLLTGHQSASQSSVIVQEPYSTSRYYLFTVDALGGGNGLRYSIVDADAVGNVVAKNIPLQSPVSEKITAVDHRYTRDAWVIVHGSGSQNDNFYAYRVTKPQQPGASAIRPPVISRVGISHAGSFPNNKTIGCMKASPDGRKLALAMQDSSLIEIYDFNDSSGVVSNPVRLRKLPGAYGIEFSRDGSKLYVSTQGETQEILQFNLQAGKGHPDSIRLSMQGILITRSLFAASLQLGIDGKIYVANTDADAKDRQYLGVINAPDSLGSKSKPLLNSLKLNANTHTPVRFSEQGLPNFNQSYLWLPAFKFKYRCIGDLTQFSSIINRQIKGIRWDFGDPDSGPDNTSSQDNPTHKFTKPNTYNVTLTVTLLNNRTRSLTIPVTIAPLPNVFLGMDQWICPTGEIKLKGPEEMARYQWSNGSSAQEIKVTKPGIYWLEVENENGCKNRDSVNILPKPGPVIFQQKLLETCAFVPLKLRTSYRSSTYKWGDGSTDSTLWANREGWYKVTVPYDGCKFTDSVQVVFKECPELLVLPNIITPNNDGQNDKLMLRGIISEGWQLQIFNRWGTPIFEDKNYRNTWPEKAPAAGIYYYLLRKPEAGISRKGWIEVVH
ncbi:T9SS type B sorting domain-containing protein [Adhaeribacter soli]|nr:gliding motility-associated C-terminal domain-containing protein [Adhaeribacter soli]